MPAQGPVPARTRHRLRWGVLGVVGVVAGGALVVLLNRDERQPTPAATSRPEPSASVAPDLTRLPIPRAPFCGALDAAAVRTALGAPVVGSSSFRPGQRVLLTPGLRDVSHEYACVFRARSGAQARVWVFAEPVTQRVAAGLAQEGRRSRDCRPATGVTAFGDPSTGTVCPGPRRPGRVVVRRGLFGDAWLSCELSTTGTETTTQAVQRADRWCVDVATALVSRAEPFG